MFSVGEAGVNGMNHAACDLFRNVCVQPSINYVYYYYEILSSSTSYGGYYVYFYYIMNLFKIQLECIKIKPRGKGRGGGLPKLPGVV